MQQHLSKCNIGMPAHPESDGVEDELNEELSEWG
jgi:hypothetical protein